MSGNPYANRRDGKEARSFASAKVPQPNAREWSRRSVMSVFAGNSPTVCALMIYQGLLELVVILVLLVKDLEAIQGNEFIHFID